MSYLYDEIVSRNLLVPPSERDDGYIASVLSEGRTKLVPTPIGVGDILNTLGPIAGAALLDTMEAMATTTPHIKWTLKLIGAGTLNVALPVVRANIDAFVTASVLTHEQGEALKNLAVVPDPITVEQVTKAFEGREV